ncbi:MAG: T9SS type A sorting domain-containing protein, partial [Bacteroidetes bacterium]|nr:T9SS type A sorting domain-containing protein [Bacteroidota bacterium]
YLDNVEVTRVNAQPLDPAERHKLLVNDQAAAQSFTLPAGCWSDMQGNVLHGSVDIQPMSSAVIYRLPDDACDITTSTYTEPSTSSGATLTMYPNPSTPGSTLHLSTAARGQFTLTDMKGTVVMTAMLAAAQGQIKLPASIAPGMYLARFHDEGTTAMQKLIVQ